MCVLRIRHFAGGYVLNGIAVISHLVVFIAAISGIWGWQVFGAVNFLVLLASVLDHRKDIRTVLWGKVGSGSGEVAFTYYLLTLLAISAIVNLTLLVFFLKL